MDPDDANIGSTILAEEGYDSIEAAKAVLNSGGLAVEVNNHDVKEALVDFLEQEGETALQHSILPEPASLISIAAIKKISQPAHLKSSDIVVSIITGHGMKAKDMIIQLLPDKMKLHQLASEIIEKKKHDIYKIAAQKGKRINVPADFDAVVQAFKKLKTD